jgi:transcriptional regulator with XRE-family HTH domain
MSSSEERLHFAQRLRQAMRNAHHAASGTQLAKEFNMRVPGNSVTVHAARKWLTGEAIPTQEKLVVLAKWLGVSSQWLRYGIDTPHDGGKYQLDSGIEPTDVALIEDLHRLDEAHRKIVRLMVSQLVDAETGGVAGSAHM